MSDKGLEEYRLGAAGDELVAELMAAHEGLSDADSARLNARLVLLLANKIGDAQSVLDALRRAKEQLGEGN